GITATMTDSPGHHYNNYYSIRVTLTGPVVTRSQWNSVNPGRIARPSLPQVFELVGRDSSGNAVVKYGFELKQWFINRGNKRAWGNGDWCTSIGGYRNVKVQDLTNASCQGVGANSSTCRSATPTSPDDEMRRHIGAGFFTEWGAMGYYTAGFYDSYVTTDGNGREFARRGFFEVHSGNGRVSEVFSYYEGNKGNVACVYP
ncbi:hypothetical protein, partial [Gilliamella apis]|uniref:hypothetical protein n=1 Tax=Gilliamella apis TaxID=1970738 RepID=UPI000B74DEF2